MILQVYTAAAKKRRKGKTRHHWPSSPQTVDIGDAHQQIHNRIYIISNKRENKSFILECNTCLY